jgi:hypothetical protein
MNCRQLTLSTTSLAQPRHHKDDDEDDLLATPVLFRLQDRLPGLRLRGRDSLAGNLYLSEKKPKAYGGQNS